MLAKYFKYKHPNYLTSKYSTYPKAYSYICKKNTNFKIRRND